MPRSWSALCWRLAGGLVFLAAASPLVWHYLIGYSREIWQLDLEVYRSGAHALVTGFPLYQLYTGAPQFLPFTYPPFSAIAGLPLLLAPFSVMGWVWTGVQLALLWWTVGRAFGEFLDRFGGRAGLVQGALAAGGVWLLPVSEGLRYGQVNAVIVALCLWDVTRRFERGGDGVGAGLAAAIKLTPAVFWLHWAVARRWRALAVSLGSAAGATLLAAVVAPRASVDYWTGALTDPNRLGPNAGTANQSMRGTLLRIGPGPGFWASLLWAACVLVVLAGGLALSRRLDRLGDPVAVVAAVGLVAFLVSPVSWVHHLHWGVVVIAALLGDGRVRRRVVAAGAGAVLLWLRLPWWGGDLVHDARVPRWFSTLLQDSYTVLALVGLVALWLVVRPAPVGESGPASAEGATEDSAQPARSSG